MELKTDAVGQAIVPVLACVLDQLCNRNNRLSVSKSQITKFHALRPPVISIKDYLQRIGKYAACSGECFVLALIYIDRIIASNPVFVVNSLNIHRLLITSVMLAAKFFDDQYFNNAYYAKVGGVPGPEMNTLEVEFLSMSDFSLAVSTETYTQYYTELCNHAHNSGCGCMTTEVPPLVIPPLDQNNFGAGSEVTHGVPSDKAPEEEETTTLAVLTRKGSSSGMTDSPKPQSSLSTTAAPFYPPQPSANTLQRPST